MSEKNHSDRYYDLLKKVNDYNSLDIYHYERYNIIEDIKKELYKYSELEELTHEEFSMLMTNFDRPSIDEKFVRVTEVWDFLYRSAYAKQNIESMPEVISTKNIITARSASVKFVNEFKNHELVSMFKLGSQARVDYTSSLLTQLDKAVSENSKTVDRQLVALENLLIDYANTYVMSYETLQKLYRVFESYRQKAKYTRIYNTDTLKISSAFDNMTYNIYNRLNELKYIYFQGKSKAVEYLSSCFDEINNLQSTGVIDKKMYTLAKDLLVGFRAKYLDYPQITAVTVLSEWLSQMIKCDFKPTIETYYPLLRFNEEQLNHTLKFALDFSTFMNNNYIVQKWVRYWWLYIQRQSDKRTALTTALSNLRDNLLDTKIISEDSLLPIEKELTDRVLGRGGISG